MSSLPVAAVLPELLTALDCAPQVLLSAPTGAGNQRLPLQLLAHPGINGKIILLEPRRLAARNVAQRLAELLNEKPCDTVITGCVRKTASGRIPARKWLPKAC